MQNVYESCPAFENERWLLRLISKDDTADLLEVYSDKNALPFFNSDNCDGDNFYYPTMERMQQAVDFWDYSYKYKWFVRWAIVDKSAGKAVGTIEMFQRLSDDDFDKAGVIRVDLGSTYERAEVIYEILSLIIPSGYEMFGCDRIISKVPIYAVERQEAFSRYGFEKTDSVLVAKDGAAFNGYWIIRK